MNATELNTRKEKDTELQEIDDMKGNEDSTTRYLAGDKLHQKRARAVLPLLVREASQSETVYYSDFAAELGMPNERNLNYVLGYAGSAL